MARRQRKAYLLRWNPNISIYTRDRFEEDMKNFVAYGTGPEDMNWNIYDYKDVQAGDLFFMAQVGCEVNGIVWGGYITDVPYKMYDDNGIQMGAYWVDVEYLFMQRIEKKHLLTSDRLSKIAPEIDWTKGHSGILLSEDAAEKLALAIGNELLHADEDENLVFHYFEERSGSIVTFISYLCPKLKQQLIDNNQINNDVQKDKENGTMKSITDLSVNYDTNAVLPDAKLEDILYVEHIIFEAIPDDDYTSE